jgi:REP element-mobilizing transposase RayT
MESRLPDRKRPTHFPAVERFNRSDIVFVTVCTQERRPLLARDAAVVRLVEAWRQADAWQVGRYVVLPDHLHLFCAPAVREAPSLVAWVKYWKALVSFAWPWPDEKPIWQQSFWDRQLRDGEHYSARWDYVRNNPVRHRLVQRAEAWPWQGELNEFRFHDPA